MSRWIIGCLILTLATAVPVFAGTLYVPTAENTVIEGIEVRTQLWVSNQGTEPRRFSTLLLAEGSDGTDRESGASDEILGVPPQATVFLNSVVGEGEFGMLELEAAPQIAVSARLVSFVNGVAGEGAALPVISSENLVEAGDLAELVPLSKLETEATDLTVVNLAFEPAECSINLFRANGTTVVGTSVISLEPLSMRRFPDVLGIVGVDALAAGRASVTCDQSFYAYATTINTATGEIVVTKPAGLGTSTLKRPGDEPPPAPCPAGAECFAVDGDFFTPQRGDDKRRIEIPVTKNVQFSRFVIDLDFRHGGWFDRNPSGIHNIIWVTRTGKYAGDTVAFVTTRGPNRDLVRNEITANLPRGTEGRKVTQNVALEPGTLYHLLYEFDGESRQVSVTITEKNTGRLVVGLFQRDGVPVRTGSGTWSANFSDNFVEAHVPSHGWTFSNFEIRFLP
ncbi:MAG: hypothetical protein KDD47_10815 [Acidobacteria bacterium]|nr:hypothetical protein [Acidobacteriota bacterium]